MLAVSEVVYRSPWEGLTIDLNRTGPGIGPILCELGCLRIETSDQNSTIKIDDLAKLSGIGLQCLRNVILSKSAFEAILDANTDTTKIRFLRDNPIGSVLENTALEIENRVIKILAHSETARLVVRFAD